MQQRNGSAPPPWFTLHFVWSSVRRSPSFVLTLFEVIPPQRPTAPTANYFEVLSSLRHFKRVINFSKDGTSDFEIYCSTLAREISYDYQ